MSGQKFIATALIILFLPLIASAALVIFRYPTSKNQVVAWRQLEKLQDVDKTVDTVILGDSSAGMALDMRLFDNLTGAESRSLVLTGSYGIHGNLILLERAKRQFPNLRRALFIISPSTWQEQLNPEAYYLLRAGSAGGDDPFVDMPAAKAARADYFNWLFTPRRLFWLWEDRQMPDYERGVWDTESGYIVQGPMIGKEAADIKWSVHMRLPDPEALRPYLLIWSDLCEPIQCVIAQGPVYSGFAKASGDSLKLIDAMLTKELASKAAYAGDAYVVEHDMLGDDFNHIRPEARAEATRHYADIFTNYSGQ